MKTSIKHLLAATLITATASTAMASPHGERGEYRDCNSPKHAGFMGGRHNPKEMMAREFSADEIIILAQAKLLMKGNDNLKVGKVSETKTGFTVAIVTKDGSLVEKVELAPNGMPLEKYEHIKERMEKRGKH
jgi:hypothetical protein